DRSGAGLPTGTSVAPLPNHGEGILYCQAVDCGALIFASRLAPTGRGASKPGCVGAGPPAKASASKPGLVGVADSWFRNQHSNKLPRIIRKSPGRASAPAAGPAAPGCRC